jgi:hypothetical protein
MWDRYDPRLSNDRDRDDVGDRSRGGSSERDHPADRDPRDVFTKDSTCHVFDQLVEEEKVLKDLYAPLRDRLVGADGTLAKLAFVIERAVDPGRWCQRGEELFDLRMATSFVAGTPLRGSPRNTC